jgi:hypothetical protein
MVMKYVEGLDAFVKFRIFSRDAIHNVLREAHITDRRSYVNMVLETCIGQLPGQAKTELESKVMELSNQPTVELEKVLVPGAGATPAPVDGATAMPVAALGSMPSAGQVVVVNREYDFIVMNLGKNHGLSIGQEFQVVRGSEVLGRVKVEKVYDELAAAAILPESQKDNIREGDTVRAL